MRLLGLFEGEARRTAGGAVLMLGIASLLVAGQLALVNRAALYPSSKAFQVGAIVAFALLVLCGFLLRSRGSAALMSEVEKALLARRRRLFDRIRSAELRAMEQQDGLDAGFNRDIEQIAALTPVLIDCLVYAMMFAGLGIYLSVLSPLGALVWAVTLALLGGSLHAQRDETARAIASVDEAWPRRRRLVEQLTRGFAQLKMDAAAAAALRAETTAAGRALDEAQLRRLAFDYYRAPLSAMIIFQLGLGFILFFQPIARAIEPGARFEIITVLLLSYRAVTYLVDELGVFLSAEQAVSRLEALEERLTSAVAPTVGPVGPALRTFERIELCGVSFSYREQDRPTFTVGPLHLQIQRGEVVFITGSNGSGKTTLMKLLTGLYAPEKGQILLDGEALTAGNRERYRSLFSSVFMDHHLFGPAYGLDVSDPQRIAALLARFNLAGVVRFEHGRFTPLDLSTGQRQRLAMVVALLEDRPIYVLDEWAAHQDPHLRRYFYETLLPEMRAAGKTVVAISHDVRFFHLADRRLHLVDGQLHAATEGEQRS